MPRPGPDLYSFEALWRHYRHCRQHKRNTLNALAFESDAEAKLLRLGQGSSATTHGNRSQQRHPGSSTTRSRGSKMRPCSETNR
jgi:hypothetical protein